MMLQLELNNGSQGSELPPLQALPGNTRLWLLCLDTTGAQSQSPASAGHDPHVYFWQSCLFLGMAAGKV